MNYFYKKYGFLLLLFVWLNANSQAPVIQWQRAYGGVKGEAANSIEQTNDGGYIIAGQTNDSLNGDITVPSHGANDFWVVKIDISGNIQWQKTYGGSGIDIAFDIKQTQDGGYIIAGGSNSTDGDIIFNNGSNDYCIIKIDVSGNLQWQKSFGGSENDVAHSIKQTIEGGYIVAGFTRSTDGDVLNNDGYYDYWILKIDNLGNIQWQKIFGGSLTEEAYCVQQTLDKGYVLIGNSLSNNGDVTGHYGGTDYWIIKLDSLGNFKWEKSLGGSLDDYGTSIQETLDGGYILVGSSRSNDFNVSGHHGNWMTSDVWIVKTDSVGSIEWQKSFGGTYSESAQWVEEIAGKGYIIGGSTSSTNGDVIGNHNSTYDYWIIGLDTSGILQWQKCLGGTSNDFANCIKQTSDNGYIIAGYSASNDGDVTGNHGANDFWVVKLEPEQISLNEQIIEDSIELFPNPASNAVSIKFAQINREIKIQLCDLLGRDRINKTVYNTANAELDISDMADGVYVMRIDFDNKIVNKKIIVQR